MASVARGAVGRVRRRAVALLSFVAVWLQGAALPEALAQEAWLVWTAPGKGLGSTQLVDMTAQGPQVVASAAGWVAALPGRVWSLRQTNVAVPVVQCACLSEAERDAYNPEKPPARCVRKKSFAALQLVDARTGKARLVAEPPALLSAEEGEASWRTELLGQVGPYLLAAHYTWDSPCMAAHGGAAATFVAVDLRTAKPVALWSEAEAAALLRGGRGKALAAMEAALKKQGDGGGLVADMADTLTVQAVSPLWDGAGRLQPRWLFVLGWDFASSDGVWGSYSRSAWVQIPQGIKAFENQPLLPLAVRSQFAAAAKGPTPARRFGWSAVQADQRQEVLAALAGKGAAAVVEPSAAPPKPIAAAKPSAPGQPGTRAKPQAKAAALPNSGRAPGAATGQRAPAATSSGRAAR